jgi:two-component system, cell cycle sensor histidine kinase and response regulator CckA
MRYWPVSASARCTVSEPGLRVRNKELEDKLDEAQQTVRALLSGEIDSVAWGDNQDPVLLRVAQERLQANEQLLRAVFDGAIDATLIADDNGRFVDANSAACVLFGLPRERLLEHGMSDFRGPESTLRGRPLPHGMSEGHFRLLRPDGSMRDTAFRATAGILPGLNLWVLHDMTERQRAESRFRVMIEKSNEGIALLDARGKALYSSPAIERILDRTAWQLEAASAIELVHPDDLQALGAAWDCLLASPSSPANCEFRAVHRDGSTRWVTATARNFLDDPAIGAIVSNLSDITEQKASEAALRASQAVLEAAQALAHLGNWSSGPSVHDRVSWSAECARIFGREQGDAPTVEGFMQLVHPDDRAQVIAASEHAVSAGIACETEHRILRPDGEVRWVYTTAAIEGWLHWTGESASSGSDPMGSGYHAMGVVQDITARKQAEAELSAIESRYRRIVEHTSEGVWMYDANNTTTFMNPRLAEMLGCSVEDAIGRPTFAFMDERGIAEARHRIERRRRGVTERGEFRLKRCDGSDLWVSLHANPLFDEAGNFESAVVLATDITERRAADATRSRLASIVASSDDAIISRSVDGVILTWNRGAEKLTQYSAEEAVGMPIARLYPPEEAAYLTTRRAGVDAGGALEQFEMSVMRKDGSHVEVSITSSVLVNDEGVNIGASIIARDITERRRAEAALRRSGEQLLQVQKMEAVGSLAGGVAHDFNNVLSVILSYTSLITNDLAPLDPVRVDLAEVHKAGLRAKALVHQLLAFSRQQVLQPVVLDVNHVVMGIETMLRRLLREDIHLSLSTSPLAGRVYADPGQLEQVITNLAVNARDAMPNGGNLSVETAQLVVDESCASEHPGAAPGRYVMLTVTDTGTGMDASTKRRIFEPFFTTKELGKGTGLGLSTVYGIVKQSGGHVRVSSTLGQGTSFHVYLPRTDRTYEAPPSMVAPATIRRGTETILLVEDEEQVRNVARQILRKQGYTVLEAQNGGEAFLLCEQVTTNIDLLLTDVVMPRMSGRQLAERLALLRPAMKVLYMSGYTSDTIVHHGVLDTGIDFLQKPLMPDELASRVRQVLDGSARPAT